MDIKGRGFPTQTGLAGFVPKLDSIGFFIKPGLDRLRMEPRSEEGSEETGRFVNTHRDSLGFLKVHEPRASGHVPREAPAQVPMCSSSLRQGPGWLAPVAAAPWPSLQSWVT